METTIKYNSETTENSFGQEKQEENQTEGSSDMSAQEIPTLNEYVINYIAIQANYQTVKTIRQLNKLWCKGATRQFVRKSIIVLSSGTRNLEKLAAFEDDTKQLKCLSALKITIRDKFCFDYEADMFNYIMWKMAQNLKYFEIDEWYGGSFCPGPSIKLPSLETLKLDDCFRPKKEALRLLRLVYYAAPNITSVIIGDVSGDFDVFLNPLLSDDGSSILQITPRLKSLTLNPCRKSVILRALFKSNVRWEKLDMRGICLCNESLGYESEFVQFDRFLEKINDTLVSLKLGFDKQCEQGFIKFPNTFPNLTTLELYGGNCYIYFGKNELDYALTFPKLTKFSLKAMNEKHVGISARHWKVFFSPKPFMKLRHFKFEFKGNYENFLYAQNIDVKWAQKLFPNANCEIDTQL